MKTINLNEQDIQDIICLIDNGAEYIPFLKGQGKKLKALKKRILTPNTPELIKVCIKDFTKDKDEPAYDVECYINGEFDKTYDGVFSTRIYDQSKSEGHRKELKKIALAKANRHAMEKFLKYAHDNNL